MLEIEKVWVLKIGSKSHRGSFGLLRIYLLNLSWFPQLSSELCLKAPEVVVKARLEVKVLTARWKPLSATTNPWQQESKVPIGGISEQGSYGS